MSNSVEHCCIWYLTYALAVMQVLQQVTAQAAETRDCTSSLWEAQAVLLLWLSILILIPLDLVILDSSVVDNAGGDNLNYPPLAAKIMSMCQGFLGQPGTSASFQLTAHLYEPATCMALSMPHAKCVLTASS